MINFHVEHKNPIHTRNGGRFDGAQFPNKIKKQCFPLCTMGCDTVRRITLKCKKL